jgi:hypothetical protein
MVMLPALRSLGQRGEMILEMEMEFGAESRGARESVSGYLKME